MSLWAKKIKKQFTAQSQPFKNPIVLIFASVNPVAEYKTQVCQCFFKVKCAARDFFFLLEDNFKTREGFFFFYQVAKLKRERNSLK